MSDPRAEAARWLGRGQAAEAGGSAASLEEALRCYGEAIALLRNWRAGNSAEVWRDLAVAQMNRGNALQKIGNAESLAAAVRAYDETIALLGIPDFENESATRNSLGAAWMNRGLALHRRAGNTATTENLAEAIRSHREAIAVLQQLPPDESPWFRRNLSAAWINLANALLDSASPDRFMTAGDAARAALALVDGGENLNPVAADLALKARRCLCDALGHLLATNEAAGIPNDTTAAETSDAVDASLALIRHWEQRDVKVFRPIAERFFRFGTQFYRLHQPHFLAEFVLENLDARKSPGALTKVRELYAIADETLALALGTLRRSPVVIVGDPADNRLLQTSRELRAARARLSELCAAT